MTALEQVAFAGHALARSLRELRRPALWAPWLTMLGFELVMLLLLAASAHPAVSWFMAPLVRSLAGDDALRFPQLMRSLPALADALEPGALVVLGPLLAGVSTALFAQRWLGEPPAPAQAWRDGLRRGAVLVMACLPLALARIGLQAGLANLGAVRLSGISRMAAPYGFALVRGLVVVTFAYVPARVVVDQHGPFGAWASLPKAWGRGFLASLIVLACLAPFGWPVEWGIANSGLIEDRGLPEGMIALVALRFGIAAVTGLIGSGAVTLAYLGAVAPEDEAA